MARDRIKLVVHKAPSDDRRCVQISGQANAVVMELYHATGLPIGHIVSQMIIQGRDLVDIVEKEDE